MSDMTAEERQSLHGYKAKEKVIAEMDENTNPKLKLAAQQKPVNLRSLDYGKNINWLDKNKVNLQINNQGLCTAGWAFAAAESISSAHAIKSKVLVDLSA